ncbi:uncharacterized protein LOC135499786 [Lineus longissimus]|uniref:uncharacterized protein LOC135499786 n=1 Tax=Lineus longissimus TaxID=88925 RepID=UPI002B4F9DEE
MVRTRTLQFAAMYGGVIVLGTGIGLMEKIQYDMRKTDYYQKSLRILHGYKAAMDLLGEPLSAKRLNLAGRGPNKVDRVKGTAELLIPVKGSKDSGSLYAWATRIKPVDQDKDDSWQIDKCEIEIDSIKRKWKFFERHGCDNTCNKETSIPDSDDAETIVDKELFYLKSS